MWPIVSGKKLGRNSGQRKALALNLTLALLKHERITTMRAKADFVRGKTERLITKTQQAVYQKRLALSNIHQERACAYFGFVLWL